MVSMETMSSDWGRGSNWPIVSKLHFSDWFPLSCYWNRALPHWWIHLVIHSLKGKMGKYKHDSSGGGGRGGVFGRWGGWGSLCSNKEATRWINTQTYLWQSCSFCMLWPLWYVTVNPTLSVQVHMSSTMVLFIKATRGALNNNNTKVLFSTSSRPEGHWFVWTKAHSIPQPEFKCWHSPSSSSVFSPLCPWRPAQCRGVRRTTEKRRR